jgi:iron complex transport system substrate-binding protein
MKLLILILGTLPGLKRDLFSKWSLLLFSSALAAILLFPFTSSAGTTREITDATGRVLTIPAQVQRVICSGSGCLRLLTYLQAQDRVVAVDSIEVHGSPIDARPYAIANPQFKSYPIFGEFRGHDSPELIAGLDPQPQVIFKTSATRGYDPDQLQIKTNIPVVTLEYGNLTHGRKKLNQALRLMAEVVGRQERAEEVIAYFDAMEQDIRQRSSGVPESNRPSCYVGGLGLSGPHGFQSTEPSFAPFAFTQAKNVAGDLAKVRETASHANVSKEQILVWDPEVIFIDVSTMRLDPGANALDQLRTDPSYQALSAVHAERVYGLFPYNSYTQNFESIFANAYFVGKVLYPERFADVDPMAKTEEISVFLNGGPAFAELQRRFQGLAFSRIAVRP